MSYTPNLFSFNGSDVTLKGGYNSVAQKLISGTNGETPIATANIANDWANVGGNLVQTGNYYKNALVATGSDLVPSNGTGVTYSYAYSGNAHDDTGAQWYTNNNGDETMTVDFGSGTEKDIGEVRITAPQSAVSYASGPGRVIVSISYDGSVYTPVYDQSDLFHALNETILTLVIPLGNLYAVRGVKIRGIRFWGGYGFTVNEVEIFNTQYATTLNAADAKITPSAPAQFNPVTALIKDENGAEVGGSTVNCIEVVDGTPANGGTLVSYSTFKTRGLLSSSANVRIRVQPVGAQKIGTVQMTSIATNIEMTATGITQTVAGNTVLKIEGGVITQDDVAEPATPADGISIFTTADGLKSKNSSGVVIDHSETAVSGAALKEFTTDSAGVKGEPAYIKSNGNVTDGKEIISTGFDSLYDIGIDKADYDNGTDHEIIVLDNPVSSRSYLITANGTTWSSGLLQGTGTSPDIGTRRSLGSKGVTAVNTTKPVALYVPSQDSFLIAFHNQLVDEEQIFAVQFDNDGIPTSSSVQTVKVSPVTNCIALALNPTNNRILALYADGNSAILREIILSGTTVTFGTEFDTNVITNSYGSGSAGAQLVYDNNNSQFICSITNVDGNSPTFYANIDNSGVITSTATLTTLTGNIRSLLYYAAGVAIAVVIPEGAAPMRIIPLNVSSNSAITQGTTNTGITDVLDVGITYFLMRITDTDEVTLYYRSEITARAKYAILTSIDNSTITISSQNSLTYTSGSNVYTSTFYSTYYGGFVSINGPTSDCYIVISNSTTPSITDQSKKIGLYTAAYSAAQTATIVLSDPLASGFTGLTVGSNYYLQSDKTVTTVVSDYLIGVALSATELLFKDVETPNSSEATRGLAKLASTAQAQAGVNDTEVMTPLKTAQAITALGSSVTIASQAEAEAGTNNTKMITPLRVQQAIDYNAVKTLDLNISAGGTINLSSAVGYDAAYKNLRIRLTGTISANTSIRMPDITATEKHVEIKDATGNAENVSLFILKIIPDASDTIDQNLGNTNEFEFNIDYQSQTFHSHAGTNKWEA